jgi:hypothetical protein
MLGEALLLVFEATVSVLLVIGLPVIFFGLFYEIIRKHLTDMAE